MARRAACFSLMQVLKNACSSSAFVLSWQLTLNCPSPRSLRYSCSVQQMTWNPQLVPSS